MYTIDFYFIFWQKKQFPCYKKKKNRKEMDKIREVNRLFFDWKMERALFNTNSMYVEIAQAGHNRKKNYILETFVKINDFFLPKSNNNKCWVKRNINAKSTYIVLYRAKFRIKWCKISSAFQKYVIWLSFSQKHTRTCVFSVTEN